MSRATWADRLGELTALGRLPRKDTLPERSLRNWVERQRTALKRGQLSSGQEIALDAACPQWRDSARGALFNEQLLEAMHFLHEFRRFPAEDADNRYEELLGRWLGKQIYRLRDGSLDPDRHAQLDAALPGWNLRVAENQWLQTATETAAYADRHRKLPSRKSADDYERTLGAWLHNQRRRLDDGNASHRARIDALNAMLPSWRGAAAVAA